MWSKWRQFVILVIVLAALLSVSAVIYFGDFENTRGEIDPQRVARGQEIYGVYCAACHGANLEGQDNWRQRGADGLLPAPPHDETGHTWHHPDQQLFQLIKLGTEAMVGGDYKSTMEGFGDRLSDGDIDAVIEYIKSRWPEEIRRRQADITARAVQAE